MTTVTDQAARDIVVNHEYGPLVVRAPHGTGKTKLIVSRHAHLVKTNVAHPLEILVVTFTRKARDEMRQRIQLEIDEDIDHLPIMTYHGLGRSVQAMKAAADQQLLRLFDPNMSFQLIKDAMKAQDKPESRLSPTVWSPREVYDLVMDAKERGQGPEAFLTVPDSPSMQKLAEVYRRYEASLAEKKATDLPGLILGARKMLEDDYDLCVALAERYRFIMVDEWQDSSPGQYEFLRLLALGHRNLMVVGAGEPQSIYEWRRANFAELDRAFREDFPDAPPEADIFLRDNFRSTSRIIRAAAAVFAGKYPDLDLVPHRGEGEPIRDVRVPDEQAEAAFVAEEAQRLARQGLDFNAMAVLYRTNEQSLLVEHGLMGRHIPYVLQGRQHMYHKREVRDVLAYLTLSRGEDATALAQIINTPPRGIGPVNLRKIKGDQALVSEPRLTLAAARAKELGLSSKAVEGIKALQALLADLRQRKTARPADLIAHVVEATGYRAWLQNEYDGEGQLQSLRLLAREAEAYGDTDEFLAAIQAHLAEDMERPENEGVTLMTVHVAKGLQYDVLFVVGMEEGLLPYAKATAHGSEADERRLAHVAFSRARDRLYLVSTRSRADHNGRRQYPRPSRYLALLPKEIVNRVGT